MHYEYKESWKIIRGYFTDEKPYLLDDETCDYYEEHKEYWLKSLGPYDRAKKDNNRLMIFMRMIEEIHITYDNNLDSKYIKENTRISTVIESYVKLRRVGTDKYMCCCPFHKDDTPSMSVNDDKKFFYCFGCLEKGDVFTFLMKINNITFRDALEMANKYVNL